MRAAYAQQEERMAHFEEALIAVGENGRTIWDTLVGNLEEGPAKDAQLAAHARAEEIRRNAAQRQQQRTQQRQPQQQQGQQFDWQAAVQAEQNTMVSTFREMAVDAGINPDDPALDFGDASETFNTRLKKATASIKKVKNAGTEAAVAGVRGSPINTRGATGGVVPTTGGMSDLQRGAAARSKFMRQAS